MVRSAEELAHEAALFVKQLLPKEDSATLVTLSGELGAGKTSFAQGIAKALGVEEAVSSPTFVIEKAYALEGQTWQRLIHIDAYRIKSAEELEALGWKEMAADSRNLIILEWPERVAALIPEEAIRITFEIREDGRILRFNGKEENGI